MHSLRPIPFLLIVAAMAAVPAAAQVCTPQTLATLDVPGALGSPAILGNTVYFPAGSAGIAWVDVSDPSAPALGGTLDTSGQGMALAFEYFGNYLVLADGPSGIGVYTLGTDGTPALAASGTVGGSALSVIGQSGKFTVGTQEGDLVTVALGDGFTPEIQGRIAVGGPVLGQVQNLSTVFCAAADTGLVAVDVHDRTTPTIDTTYDLGGSVLSVTKDGNLLYAGVENVGIVAMKIQGTQLVTLASLSTPAPVTDLVAWSGRIYAAMPEHGILAVDSSLGQALLQIGDLVLEGADGIAQVGGSLFVGRGTRGMASVDVSDCASAGVSLTTLYIPASARATGAENTYWVTDVALANLTDRTAALNVAYLKKNHDNPAPVNASVILQAGQQLLLTDVFSSLFGLESANGALRIITSHPDVKVTSRTYNAAGANGTYGQFIPAFDGSAATVPGLPAVLTQLQQNDAFRTNIGLVNLTPYDVTVEIDLYRGSGNLLGPVSVDLAPYEMRQVDRVFNAIGAGTVDNGFAVVKTESDGAKVLTYASVVDNQSGDPIYVPSQLLLPGTPFE